MRSVKGRKILTLGFRNTSFINIRVSGRQPGYLLHKGVSGIYCKEEKHTFNKHFIFMENAFNMLIQLVQVKKEVLRIAEEQGIPRAADV